MWSKYNDVIKKYGVRVDESFGKNPLEKEIVEDLPLGPQFRQWKDDLDRISLKQVRETLRGNWLSGIKVHCRDMARIGILYTCVDGYNIPLGHPPPDSDDLRALEEWCKFNLFDLRYERHHIEECEITGRDGCRCKNKDATNGCAVQIIVSWENSFIHLKQ